MKKIALFILHSFLFPTLLWAGGQTIIPNYNIARDTYLWDQLYNDGGQGLYCNTEFGPGEKLTGEHVYSADWIADHHGCPNRKTCPIPDYLYAEADLHNLWPAIGKINFSRSNLEFKELNEEVHRAKEEICVDYERTYGPKPNYVEPQDSVKGEIARSIMYMNKEYGLPFRGMKNMLKKWNRKDPPDENEHWRNDRIEELQGTRNPYIDNYHLGNSL